MKSIQWLSDESVSSVVGGATLVEVGLITSTLSKLAIAAKLDPRPVSAPATTSVAPAPSGG